MHDTNFHIACPTDCSDVYDQGSQVVLVASPDSGSTFVGWSGAGCSGTQSCIVTMNADEAVTATFLAPGHGTLTAPVPKTRKTPPDPHEGHDGLAVERAQDRAHPAVVLQLAGHRQDPDHL